MSFPLSFVCHGDCTDGYTPGRRYALSEEALLAVVVAAVVAVAATVAVEVDTFAAD